MTIWELWGTIGKIELWKLYLIFTQSNKATMSSDPQNVSQGHLSQSQLFIFRNSIQNLFVCLNPPAPFILMGDSHFRVIRASAFYRKGSVKLWENSIKPLNFEHEKSSLIKMFNIYCISDANHNILRYEIYTRETQVCCNKPKIF